MSAIKTKELWDEILESIKVSVSPAIFSTWFNQTHLASLNKNNGRFSAEIGCKSTYVKNTIESRYFGLIQDHLSKSLEAPCDLIFIVKELPDKKVNKNGDTTLSPLFQTNSNDRQRFTEVLLQTGLRVGFNFDNFAVSSSNQMAWAAAEAVSKELGKAYNPLFIWGGVGVGKTHLMNSVGYAVLQKDVNAKVILCTGEQFTNDIVEGIRHKNTPSVRNKYRKVTALLIDDIQFIAGKDAVQEEFFHTFNSLVGSGSQIILTSDRPPSEISKLEERLQSRFEAGLIVDISEPDFELRCAIIKIKSKERGLDIPMDIVQMIAGNLESARKIEGFLVKISSEAKLKKVDITPELVENLIGRGEEINGSTTIKSTPTQMIGVVSKYFSIGKRSLLGSSRARPVARPRQILMYLLRTQLSLPLQEVGRLVGGRDHTTVMHAVDKITQLASSNVQIRQDIQGIRKML
jgi:chromosomal replication initiator protein